MNISRTINFVKAAPSKQLQKAESSLFDCTGLGEILRRDSDLPHQRPYLVALVGSDCIALAVSRSPTSC